MAAEGPPADRSRSCSPPWEGPPAPPTVPRHRSRSPPGTPDNTDSPLRLSLPAGPPGRVGGPARIRSYGDWLQNWEAHSHNLETVIVEVSTYCAPHDVLLLRYKGSWLKTATVRDVVGWVAAQLNVPGEDGQRIKN